jgi:hypothetical protein
MVSELPPLLSLIPLLLPHAARPSEAAKASTASVVVRSLKVISSSWLDR